MAIADAYLCFMSHSCQYIALAKSYNLFLLPYNPGTTILGCGLFNYHYFLLARKYLMSKPATKPAFDPSKYVKKNLTADTVTKLKEVFDVFDYDGSGNISIDELVNTVKALNLGDQASQIISIVNAAGVTGEFDFGTFVDIFGFGGDSTNEATLQTVFEAFDQSGTGAFGPEEFQKVAASVGEHFSSAEVDQMIEFADRDRDGVINFEEFAAVVTKVYPKV